MSEHDNMIEVIHHYAFCIAFVLGIVTGIVACIWSDSGGKITDAE